MPLNGTAVAAVAAGGLLCYSGIKGYSLLRAAQNMIQGNPVTKGQSVSLISSGAGGGSAPAANAGGLVGDAEAWEGKWQYVWGGSPGASGGRGDCSSFMNYVIGVQGGRAIPGFPAGKYNGSSHGPATTSWLTWSGCTTVGVADMQPGDLVVGITHMGMVTTPGMYVSARDPAEGVGVDSVNSFPDIARSIRRLK